MHSLLNECRITVVVISNSNWKERRSVTRVFKKHIGCPKKLFSYLLAKNGFVIRIFVIKNVKLIKNYSRKLINWIPISLWRCINSCHELEYMISRIFPNFNDMTNNINKNNFSYIINYIDENKCYMLKFD